MKTTIIWRRKTFLSNCCPLCGAEVRDDFGFPLEGKVNHNDYTEKLYCAKCGLLVGVVQGMTQPWEESTFRDDRDER